MFDEDFNDIHITYIMMDNIWKIIEPFNSLIGNYLYPPQHVTDSIHRFSLHLHWHHFRREVEQHLHDLNCELLKFKKMSCFWMSEIFEPFSAASWSGVHSPILTLAPFWMRILTIFSRPELMLDEKLNKLFSEYCTSCKK